MKKNFKDAVQKKINWEYDKKSSKMWEIFCGLKVEKTNCHENKLQLNFEVLFG